MGLEMTIGPRHSGMVPSLGQLSRPWPLGRYIRDTKLRVLRVVLRAALSPLRL